MIFNHQYVNSTQYDTRNSEEIIIESLYHGEGITFDQIQEMKSSLTDNETQISKNNKYQISWENTLNDISTSRQYTFLPNNSLLTTENEQNFTNYYEIGLKYFESGDLLNAIKLFEAEVQVNIDSSVGWHMLGLCHAENDEDVKAILCFKQSIDCDSYNLESLLAIGISYVNEYDSMKALHALKSWIQHNPSFHSIQVKLDEYSDGTLMDEVMQLMIEVSRQAPHDHNVKIVLGVLYNVSMDYESAVENFRQASQIITRPDYTLFNKVSHLSYDYCLIHHKILFVAWRNIS